MGPTWICYEEGVCSQAGYFSKQVSASVYCLFPHSGIFRLVVFQCYDAKVTHNELVFVVFLLPQFQLNYHIGQGVYISVYPFHASANAFLVSHPKNKGAPKHGNGTHFLCLPNFSSTCSCFPLLPLCPLCSSPTAAPPGRGGTGQDSLWMAQILGVELLFLAKRLQRGQATWALFWQVS